MVGALSRRKLIGITAQVALAAALPRRVQAALALGPKCVRCGTTRAPVAAGRAVLVGVSEVSRDVYNSAMRDGVEGSEQDAADMATLLRQMLYDVHPPLLTRAATRKAVSDALQQLARDTGPNDIAVFYYSGHGQSVPDKNGDEAADQALVLYDALLIDDDLADIWRTFPAGARLIMVADCCHSGTINKILADGFLRANSEIRTISQPAKRADPAAPKPKPSITAQMLLLGATTDDLGTPGTGTGGYFTRALLDLMTNQPPIPMDYVQLHDKLRAQLLPVSPVVAVWEPSATDAFKHQSPFSIRTGSP
jgi:hypothetical protein